jgi:hypothetical protein
MPTETFIDAGGSTKHRKSTGAGTSGDPSVLHNIIDGSVAVTGTFWQATQPVSIASSVPVTNVGTFAVQVDGAALTSLQLLDNLVLTEDAAHSSGDAGIQALAVRNDSDASLAGTSGDYTPLQVDANGYLKVNIKAGAGSGGTSATDDAAFTAGSGSGTPLMGFVTSDTVNSGDVGVVGMLDNRQLKVTLFDSSGAELSVGGGTQYDEDTAHSSGDKVTMVGVVRRDTPSSGVGADGDRAILSVDADGRLYANTVVSGTVSVTGTLAVTGTFWQATQPVSIASTLTVTGTGGTFPVTDSGGSLTVDNGGTFVVQENGAALTSLQLLDNLVLAEDAAHVSGDPGVQSLAVRNDSDTSLAGTTGDYTPLQVDANGYLKVNIKAGAGSGGTASTDDAAFTAGSGSGTPIMGFVTSDPVDSGDVGVIGMLANRQVKVTLFDSAGSEVSVGSSPTSTGPSTTDNLLVMLMRIVKLLESNAIVDPQQRQRISVDSFVATVPTVSTVTTCSTVTTVNTVAAQTTLAGMDREMHINAAKQTYSDSIRSRLTFA